MRIVDWSSDVCSSDLYDPRVARPDSLLKILRDIGYTISDPRKVRPFEEEERDLVREGRRFLIATALSLLAIGLITSPAGIASLALHGVVFVSLVGLVFLVLRARGLLSAITGAVGLSAAAFALMFLNNEGWFAAITPWQHGQA